MTDSKVIKTVEYVEEHLNDHMTLTSMSEKFYYSRSHFHRVFLAEMGMSLNRYILFRKMTKAAYVLMTTNKQVTEIALDCGYDQMDTFIRSFKRVYGITPTEYRLNRRKVYESNEEGHMSYHYSVVRKMSFEARITCFKDIDVMLELSKQAHLNGLLSLEKSLESLTSNFLKEAVKLLVDGVEPKRLRSILENYLGATDLSDSEILKRCIYLEGILMIQQGEYPWEIRRVLGSLLGEETIEAFHDYYVLAIDYSALESNYLSEQVVSTQNTTFSKELTEFNSRQMQRLIRECHELSLIMASLSLSQVLKEKILESMSVRKKYSFLELYDLIGVNVHVAHVTDAQNKIKKTIGQLRIDGDI